ncbi:Unknown protein sequence [Pseudomonas savastanoi pv. glycinea]|nr:Unknown protein sequence [Pseudomonas savastanoi pv. glycinea]RML91314.1 hypothetical protein ALQ88_102697 [Pseudomonas savastanoi]RMU43380.1 hypothetical protein ALP28_102401 [Pseudomonas savastanoi pv. nerii]
MGMPAKIKRFMARWAVSADMAALYLASDEWSNVAATESFQLDRENDAQ